MSSYSRIVLICLFAFSLSAKTLLHTANNDNDALILSALDYELNKKFNESARVYAELFENTTDTEYLDKAIAHNLLIKDFKTAGNLCKDNLDKFPHIDERLHRLYVVSLLQQSRLDEALEISQKLLKKYNNTINYEVMGNVYYAKGNYKEAVKYFESAYASSQKVKTLISLVDVLYVYLEEKQKAISYLETYLRLYGCQMQVCNKLLGFYQEQQNIDGMISILKKAYRTYTDTMALYKVQNLLVTLLERKDIKEAIKFLEDEKVDRSRLLALYERTGQYKKALALVRKLYRETKDKAYLGQIAILEFELANDKKAVMKHVIANFELALKSTDNASYKNYYGYLLIDFEIDIKKGLKLVREALKSSPNNIAYMDSVAWGYYKLGKCEKAKKYMKEVVDQVGLDNEEIKLHWNKIQECR